MLYSVFLAHALSVVLMMIALNVDSLQQRTKYFLYRKVLWLAWKLFRISERMPLTLIRRFLTSLAWLVLESLETLNIKFCCTPLNHIIDRLFKTRQVSVLQIGSNVGVTYNDPVHRWVRRKSWRGVFVEPIPSIYRQLRDSYQKYVTTEGFKKLQFLNCAVSATSTTSKISLYTPVETPETQSDAYWSRMQLTQISSVSESQTQESLKAANLPNQIEKIVVHCRTLSDIISRELNDICDFLHIDTEGLDVDLLSSYFQTAPRVMPSLILFEYRHSDRSSLNDLISLMSSWEYDCQFLDEEDMVCIHKEAL